MENNTNTAGEALDLNKLEALAKAATRGPWIFTKYGNVMDGEKIFEIVPFDTMCEDRLYIAAANPAAILELIALARASSAAPAAPTAELIEIGNRLADTVEVVAPAILNAGTTECLKRLVGEWREALAAPAAAQDAWVGVEDRLPEHECLAVYVTPNGKQRLIRAKYARQLQIEAQGDDCETEYNEHDDTFYIKAGWLECIDNWGEYSSCYVVEGVVTHWKPSPALPAIAAQPKDTTDTRRDA